MCDVAPGTRADLRGQQCSHRNCLASQRHEFNFITGASIVDMHDSADIARLQSLFGQVLRQYYAIMFLNHCSLPKDKP